ncbi:MAG: peptide-methionine (S)-S-oxide reductase [Candidatus Thorarchaeota archaeon]|nr:peptide-methionine (S)-S-oxide reductase [Candidatus Thorarchaeota archaeon]
MEIATLGGGCFWCFEAVYQEIKGVLSVVSGYAGGHVENPTYKQVTTGTTGHAEVVQIEYNPEVISYEEILEVFFGTHDPTTKNRQGNDVGPQYRSIILYHDDKQREVAEDVKARLDASGKWRNPIVTEVVPFTEFYPAEDYHQNYYCNNRNQGYCRYIISPKLDKLRRDFALKLNM